MTKKAKILELLEIVAPILPAPIYWENVDSVILGGNQAVFLATGALIESAYVGKTLFELYPKELAEHIKLHNEEVMRTGKILSQEEMIRDIATGEVKYFTAIKAPLRDDDGNIIGIVGTSVDITGKKEAEKLRVENEVQRNLAKKQEQFTEIANQVAHDIRSPLASLSMIVSSCLEIPERERIALRDVSTRINDIANNLLQQYKFQDSETIYKTEQPQALLLSATLLQFLTEKKFQYQDTSVNFVHEMSRDSQFAFIMIDDSSFKRMMSNLVNNAVDSFEEKDGIVTIRLDANLKTVKITIQDNGKGMSTEVIHKIMQNTAFTEGKADGHGIGLTQVRNTLKRAQGKMSIESKLGEGTKMILEFSRTKAPRWIAEEIRLGLEDIVVILDDDRSIHVAWDTRFESIVRKAPQLKIHHFQTYQAAFHFIQALTNTEKDKVFLLTDYELVKQKSSGLSLVENTKIKRAILVTSHYANIDIQKRANRLNTKILPKQLASEILIHMDEITPISTEKKDNTSALKIVDAVFVDDDASFIQSLTHYTLRDKQVDTYSSPSAFRENLEKYPKETPIYTDNNFDAFGEGQGLDLAEELHNKGYTRLFILTGDISMFEKAPSYVTVVLKTDLDKLSNV